MNKLRKSHGFTLIELVMVIVLLGIMSVGVTSFMGLGTRIYIDVSNRDELIASARFAVERLNRELRLALPNSARVANFTNAECLEFVPIIASGSYQDLPVSPESAGGTVTMIAEGSSVSLPTESFAAAYVLLPGEVYDGALNKRHSIASATIPPSLGLWTLNFSPAVHFAADSPTERLYVVDKPVSYCVEGTQLIRYHGYNFSSIQALPAASNGTLMADFLDANASPFFQVHAATLERNSIVTFTLALSRNQEDILLGNEIQVVNVP